MNVVIGLDPADRFAYSVLDVSDGHVIEYGTWSFRPGRGESFGMRFVKARRIIRELITTQCMKQNAIALVMYEQQFHRGGYASSVAKGYETIILALCAENKINHKSIPPATLKKHATGMGRCSKADMIAACIHRLAIKPANDDEADAIWLGHYGVYEVM